ncbi:MAG TPA: endopeptidase La [Anaerolineaceae bacterium]|nr:endopeptidase La [Longilinea sp.]HNR46315.1 endopeptidase La [Anaerolineaceae bacterium]HNZ13320.1 endopeptidase La [Anaerolineaceae bacterium]HOD04022.1 endopeptidase La [Anaerolineaceae bacterium]HQF63110.1 endopeptidase La [Anaerolineaceae bacterium]
MKDNQRASRPDDSEDYISALHQRTEELYQVPDMTVNEDGTIEAGVLILRDVVVFPHMVSPIFVPPGPNLLAIEDAQEAYETMIALIVSDPDAEAEPTQKDFLPIGVEVAVGRLLSMPDDNNSALIQGRRRLEVLEFTQTEPYFRVRARVIVESTHVDRQTEALMRTSRDLFERCVQLDRSLPEEAHLFSLNIQEPGWLADMIATAISLPFTERQKLITITDPQERLKHLNWLLAQELDVLQLEDEIQTRVQSEVDRSQREFYLREQMKAIQTELGDGDPWMREIEELRNRINQSHLPDAARTVALKELERLAQMPQMAPEVGMLRSYIDWLLELPWDTETEDNLDVRHAAGILDQYHYGLGKAKDRILEFIAVRSLKPRRTRQPILCFVGPPGTGKTSLGRSIAEALGRKFVRLSLGGVRDEAEIRGHRRTYIGALPGRILQTMRRAGSTNPLFMLDEIDKLGADFRGDPAAALLEVLDPEQNAAFSDHYLEVDYDLSRVMFITTANSLGSIPPALLDRMEVLDFPGYIEEEKLEIARRFLIPRQVEESGLETKEVTFPDQTVRRLIREYTYEAGVRNLEREIGRMCRKVARQKAEGKPQISRLTPATVERFLGPPQFFVTEAERQDEVGVATALAWTESGGDIMPVEILILDGKGSLQITGQIGEVMQESAQAALSYLKSRAAQLQIDPSIFEKVDIHIHIPEGAIPKDGPSAGITIAAALISAFTERPVYRHVGMTGEITLRGRVLPVGGVREKILAAHRAGLKVVLLPHLNLKDLVDVPKKVMTDLKIVPLHHMDEVLEMALYPPTEKAPRPARRKRAPEAETPSENE